MFSKTRKADIFLVDDHPVVRESLRLLLNHEPDFTVIGEAEDAQSALKEISAKKPDLAIIDISLHASSGFDLIKALKSKLPRLGIVVFSMHDEKLYAERCIRAGAAGYVMKRESTKRILTTVRDVLVGNLGVSEQVMAHFSLKFIGSRYTADHVPLSELSDRELEIFNLLGLGLASRKIAQSLDVNIKTVQAHCANIKQKLGLSTATELLREATKWHDSSSAF
jgi:DNA-binding NarL/FixJ family response regulator